MLDGVLRTEDARFNDLPGFDYAPQYIEDLDGYQGLRIHYVDEGPADAEHTYLCLHGEPTWAYLFRKMMPVFLKSGARVIAPDWLGFGRSDKPIKDETYTYHYHRTMMLRLGVSPGKGFEQWRAYAASKPDLDVGGLMARSCPNLSESERAAYDAPFPDQSYKAGVRQFPQLVMTRPDMEGVETSKAALKFWREEWEGESFMAIGAQDPVLGTEIMQVMQKIIRNCPEPKILPDAGHFVQEWGEEVAIAALEHFSRS